jgi:hypothetical protein
MLVRGMNIGTIGGGSEYPDGEASDPKLADAGIAPPLAKPDPLRGRRDSGFSANPLELRTCAS